MDLFPASSTHNLKMFLTLLLVIFGTQTSVTQKPGAESADVVLLLDSSNALGRRAFASMKMFVNRMINSLTIGPNKYRVALAQYSDDVYVEFQLSDFKTKSLMLNHIKKNFAFKGGSLRTGNAIQKVHEIFFKTPTKGKNQVVVVATSGTSEDDVERPAKILQHEGVKIIALGMQAASVHELHSIATPPFYYRFETPKDLLVFSQNISNVIKSAIEMDIYLATPTTPSVIIPTTPSVITTPPGIHNETTQVADCLGDSVADAVFVVDESVSNVDVRHVKKFLENTVNFLDVKKDCIRIGLVKYSTEPQVLSLLSKETEKSDILQQIQRFSPRQGKANLGAAINVTRKQVFTSRAGSRGSQGVEQIATIITHRPSDDSLVEAANLLLRDGVTVFTIGIEGANITQLTKVVSYPPDRNIIKLPNYSSLPSKVDMLRKKIFNKIQDKLYVQATHRGHLKAGCMDTEKADIYFLIDGSSSIYYQDFYEDMKTFLKEVMRLFTIGPDHVRFGVVQYSSNHRVEFEIDEYTKASSLEKAINNIKQLTGDTYTGEALKYMRPLFEKARKQRNHKVPCYLIVLTDGEAHDNVLLPATMLRNAGINIFAIGVKEANRTQLYEIAGSESRVYFVQQFSLLKNVKNEIVQELCSEEACKEKEADVMFLVDSSNSIGFENFKKMQDFMKELVNQSDIGLDQVRIGIVQFSTTQKEEFRLNSYSTKSDIIEAIGKMPLLSKNTYTGEALQFVADYFTPAKGARPSVNKILILITDGEAQDEVKTPAETLREKGIIIYSVGVFNANKTQLEEISGSSEKVFYVESFDILNHIKGDIKFGICSPHKPDECKTTGLLDIVFVIDSSGSIGYNYDFMKDFMIDIVNKADIDKGNVQFGAMKYSDTPQTLFYLNTYRKKSGIIDKIRDDTLLGETTYTAEALRHAEALFTEEHGSRKSWGVPQVLMVITDGDSHDKEKLDDVSTRLRDSGITILAIGIKDAKPDELLIMAGKKENYFYVDTFHGLKNLTVIDDYCPSPGCDIYAEIVFLIDGSKSISGKVFDKVKDFLTELVDLVGYNGNVLFGMAQFSEMYQEEFSLGDYQNKSELKDKINNITIEPGRKTYIGKALREVKAFFKSPKRRVARNTHQMLLIITDGKSDDSVAQPAEELRNEGVEIHAIGVGKINHMQLQQITNSPDRKYTTADYNALSNITKRVTEELCKDDDKSTCFVDVLMGFDISSQKPGDHLLKNQHLLETYLPGIINYFTSTSTVSCNKGTTTQFSVATQIENSDPPVLATLQVDHEKILETLRNVVLNDPSHLNVKFLDTLWNTFQKLSDNQNRSKVIILFSDGLDDDIEALEKKSEELRKQGLDGLITVVLEGAIDFHDLLYMEFGKGFGYNDQLTIGTQHVASRLFEYVDKIAEKTCCCVHCKCVGEKGSPGRIGKMGSMGSVGPAGAPGYLGEDGEPGHRGIPGADGDKGCRGDQGNKGQKGLQGHFGEKGENGIDGLNGIDGEQGSDGRLGLKGEKGNQGQMGSPGSRGLPGDHGQKGFSGDSGHTGMDNYIKGVVGLIGTPGSKGERGPKGSAGGKGFKGNKGSEGRRGISGPPGEKGIPGPDGLSGEQGFQGPQGTIGGPGVKGEKGYSGNKGLQGNFGVEGPKGSLGRPGPRGNKGEPGGSGEKGERGFGGQQGMPGDDGRPGYGKPGIKGSKGEEGFPGDFGKEGEAGDMGISGEQGPKGSRGRMGPPALKGEEGDPGATGYPGRPGTKGARGLSSFSPCELTEYVRSHSPCWTGIPQCPVYPTELVFALDISQDTTFQLFQHMKEIVIEIVNNTNIRESNCPVGARVAVVSYNSDTHYLIRFSDFHSKSHLLWQIQTLSYQRSTHRRDLGGCMRFVARNIFKRTLQGGNVRKVAVFFSNGQSHHPNSISTAVLELSALDIHPAVIAFKNIPEVNKAFAMATTGLFQVFNINQHGDYSPVIQRLKSCVLCYDKCKPVESCVHLEISQPQAYLDAVFILESSRKISHSEFDKVKDFLSTALDNFDVSDDPKGSLSGDRVAVVSHAPREFMPQRGGSPVRVEFDFATYTTKGQMKRHIQESVQQLNGESAVGHAIQWAIDNLFSKASNQRKYKAIFIVSMGVTSQWDKEVLSNATLRAKCQGYPLFVLSIGQVYDDQELRELASFPLEHHLMQLGRIHKAELSYAENFLKPFIRFLKNEVNSYPHAQLRRRCANINAQKPVVVVPQQQRPMTVPNGIKFEDAEFLQEHLVSDSENVVSSIY